MIDNQEDRAIASHRSVAPSGAEPQGSRAKPPAAIAGVTQADRDAAADYLDIPGLGDALASASARIRSGQLEEPLVRAFAKHRTDTIESLATLAGEMAEALKAILDEAGHMSMTMRRRAVFNAGSATLAKWEELNVADRP